MHFACTRTDSHVCYGAAVAACTVFCHLPARSKPSKAKCPCHSAAQQALPSSNIACPPSPIALSDRRKRSIMTTLRAAISCGRAPAACEQHDPQRLQQPQPQQQQQCRPPRLLGRRQQLGLGLGLLSGLGAALSQPAAVLAARDPTPYERGQNLEYGLLDGRIRSCPSDANPNCVSTASQNEASGFCPRPAMPTGNRSCWAGGGGCLRACCLGGDGIALPSWPASYKQLMHCTVLP